MLENISPRLKRYGVWAAVIGGVLAAVTAAGPSEKPARDGKKGEVRHVLTDFDTRKVGVDSLAANIRLLRTENGNMNREIAALRHRLELLQKNAGLLRPRDGGTGDPAGSEEVRELREELRVMRSLLPKDLSGRNGGPAGPRAGNPPVPAAAPLPPPPAAAGLPVFPAAPPAPVTAAPSPRAAKAPPVRPAPAPRKRIRTVSDAKFAEVAAREPRPGAAREGARRGNGGRGYYLAPGTIISGMLLTGLDAPTKEDAKGDPFPALISVDREAILPNEATFDLRECFVIAAGYGDMSSERVYLRAETLSCVAGSGRVIEAPLAGYAAGEDGKAGLRGRLVSKQGKLIARSLAAGFLEGLSGAFDVSPVPVISTTSDSDSLEYKNVYSGRALRGAAASGSSKALERVASFYLKLAQEMFPVLEVDAARRADIILTRGLSLDLGLGD